MSLPKTVGNKIFCITYTPTGEFVAFGSKVAWIRKSDALRAFEFHTRGKEN